MVFILNIVYECPLNYYVIAINTYRYSRASGWSSITNVTFFTLNKIG